MDSCRQPDAASVGGEEWRRIDRARKSHRQLRKEGPPLRRAGRAGRRQRPNACGVLPPHRDLPAARAGGGTRVERQRAERCDNLVRHPREGGGTSTPRPLHLSLPPLEYWIARSSRATTILIGMATAIVKKLRRRRLRLRILYRAP